MKETGLSYKTVSKHWDSDQIDIQKYVTEINLEYTHSDSISKNDKIINDNDKSVFEKVEEFYDFDVSKHPLLFG